MRGPPHIDISLEAEAQRLRIESSYDVAFVNALKLGIPWRERTWDEPGHVWYVDVKHAPLLRQLALMYPRARWVEGQQVTDLHTGRVTWRQPPAEQLSLWS
jgi:hypothetical protein